ncbi:GTPase-activating protein gyp10 [Byssothecium circinans]|uniref:GTPase-activating protein gyp10 n=1 Tax=Byssothecium circinans TaxID=147558 RepID=A0A6A5T9Y8_9PLEO|nr:GTPase-activating protein gyp10 [Byssothecium circinans]
MASRTSSSSRAPSRSVSSGSLPLPTRRNTVTTELSPAGKEKAALITTACEARDLEALVRLATSTHGLVSDILRRKAWPILLGCHGTEEGTSWKGLPPHGDEEQVALDVNRAFVYYPKNESEKQLDRRKEQLSDVIIHVLRKHPALCYFQGYHDIVQVLLLVLGPQDAPTAVARLSVLRIRDFMLSNMDPAMSQLELLRPVLATADPTLYAHLPKNRPSTFALPGTITLFAHILKEYKDIARLFDFFLASHTVMPIYFFAAIVLSRREEILDIDKEDEDIMSAILGRLPEPFDVEFHIARTVELHERLPPHSLGSWEWWRISSSSVLKTSTPFHINRMTLEEGEKLFQEQEKEIRRRKTFNEAVNKAKLVKRQLWVYRRHGAFGLALAVGVYALWLGRSSRSASFGSAGDFLRRVAGRWH